MQASDQYGHDHSNVEESAYSTLIEGSRGKSEDAERVKWLYDLCRKSCKPSRFEASSLLETGVCEVHHRCPCACSQFWQRLSREALVMVMLHHEPVRVRFMWNAREKRVTTDHHVICSRATLYFNGRVRFLDLPVNLLRPGFDRRRPSLFTDSLFSLWNSAVERKNSK